MDRLSREAFADRLGRLDDAELAAFVADCWGARGWTTTVAGDVVVAANHPDRPDRRLGVGPDTDAPTVVVGSEDAAAAADAADGRPVLGPAELHGLVAYAVDPGTGDRLCRTHLGVGLDHDPGPGVLASVGQVLPARRTAESVALLCVVAAGLLLFTPLGPSLPGAGASASAPPATAAPPTVGEEAAAGSVERPTTDADAGEVGVDPDVPGLSADGVTDANLLADAHADAVTGRSYRLTLAHREWIGDEIAGGAREVVTVAGPTTYVTAVERWGRLQTTPAVVVGTEAYADGEYRYERVPTANGTTVRKGSVVRPSGGEGFHADRVERYVRWFLEAEESDVTAVTSIDGAAVTSVIDENESVLYRVTASGTAYEGAEEYEATALVTDEGFVRQLQVSYDVPDSDARVSISIRYAGLDRMTVEPPGWYTEATGGRNGTAAPPTPRNGTDTSTPRNGTTTSVREGETARGDAHGGGALSTGDVGVET